MSGGELATLDESKKHVAGQAIRHPILWDQGNRNHKNYGITSWPAAYLIGADGKVFWQGNPARMQDRPEEVESVRKLLDNRLSAVRRDRK